MQQSFFPVLASTFPVVTIAAIPFTPRTIDGETGRKRPNSLQWLGTEFKVFRISGTEVDFKLKPSFLFGTG